MWRDTFACTRAPGPESLASRLAIFLWCVATLSAPRIMARQLVHWRFQ